MDTIKTLINKLPKKDLTYITVLVVLCIFLFRGCSYEESLKEELMTSNTLHNAVNDSLTQYKNKDSLWVAQTTVLVGTIQTIKREHSKKYQFQNAEIDRLVNLINKRTESATVFNTVTHIKENVKVEHRVDTVHHFDSTYISSKIIVNHRNEWIALSLEATNDSANFDLSVINKYDVSIEREKWEIFSPFKKRETKVQVTNLNPYTQTTQLESFIPLKEKKKYRGLKYGVAFVAGFIVAKKL